MSTRYDLMKDSETLAPNGEYYPDILYIPLQNFRYRNSTYEHTMSSQDIKRFDTILIQRYQSVQYRQIVLWLNNVGFVSDLEPGYIMIFPDIKDLQNFYLEN